MTLSRSIEGLMTQYSLGGKWVEPEIELVAVVGVGPAELLVLGEKDVPWPSGVACSKIGLSIAAIGEDITYRK